jgi:hypothetical protein
MAGIRDLISRKKMDNRAERSGRPPNHQKLSQKSINKTPVEQVVSVAGMVGSLIEIMPMFGEVPRLPNPDKSEAVIGGLGDGNTQVLLNEMEDRYGTDNTENFVKKYMAGKIESGKLNIERKNMFQKFFNEQTVQKTNLFLCSITSTKNSEGEKGKVVPKNNIELQNYHFKSVSFKLIPDINVEKVNTVAFPVINPDQAGFDVTVTFVEDAYGTVLNFIMESYSRLMRNEYMMNTAKDADIGALNITILNDSYTAMQEFIFTNFFITSVSEVSLDYTQTTAIKEYQVTFHANSRVAKMLGVRIKDVEALSEEVNSDGNVPNAGQGVS